MKQVGIVLAIVAALHATAPAAPNNDDWRSPARIDRLPFVADIDVRDAGIEPDPEWRCISDGDGIPNRLLGTHGDVWFELTIQDGGWINVVAEMTRESPFLELYRRTDGRPRAMSCPSLYADGDPVRVTENLAPGVYLLRVGGCKACAGDGRIRFVVGAEQITDLAVENLEVTRPPLAAGTNDPVRRVVEFDVVNVRGVAARGNWHVHACHDHKQEGDYCTLVANGVSPSLEPGDRVRIAVTWTPLGSVGDFSMCASVSEVDADDPNLSNNRERAHTWIVAGNTDASESFLDRNFHWCF